ncbi:hypothetical protein K435DRAFT_849093 [Dendrothele bispora CBS 962.96]|uniref:Ribonuclease H1 N-terminal domain-containing protein n=1 Tax=Dendrothele bispora (strain CBS 962.96) TaxID=1314807 RepID=A0A4S8MT17_DENBC|nr:hypothetical protein K435DRAFT_849093 [Dendrothele bispora CBS 962.96]
MHTRVRHIVLRPGESIILTVASSDADSPEPDLCPECESNLGVFHGPPRPSTPSTPPPPFSTTESAPSGSVEVIPPALSAAQTVSSDIHTASLPRSDIVTIQPPGLEINRGIPIRTSEFVAYKVIPHPDELERVWPLDHYVKTYAVFKGIRVGMFPSWEITQPFVFAVSRADFKSFKKFSDAMVEYRKRYNGHSIVAGIQVLDTTVCNDLFDINDSHYDCDLKILVHPDDKPIAVPIDVEPENAPPRFNNDYALAPGVLVASVPGSSRIQYGTSGIIDISDEDD